MNLTETIASMDPVKDKPWPGPQGPIWFAQGKFQGGGIFSIGSQSIEKAREKHAELSALIGTEGVFEVEEKGEYQGNPKYKLKAWPGNQPRLFGGGGGGGGGGGRAPFVPRYRDSEEGFAREQRSIHRSVALQRAIEADANREPQAILQLADTFYAWLSQDTPQASQTEPQKPPSPGALTTGDKVPPPYDHYIQEIDEAIHAKDANRLDKLQNVMIVGSLEQKSITLDEATVLNDLIERGKKVIASAILFAAWVKEKQAEAMKREPISEGEKQLNELRDRF